MKTIIRLSVALSLCCLAIGMLVRADIKAASDLAASFEATRQKLDNLDGCSLPGVMEINDLYHLYQLLPDGDKKTIEEASESDSGPSYSLKLINDVILQDWDLYRDKMNPKLASLKDSAKQQMKKLVENYQMIRFNRSSCEGDVDINSDIFEGFDSDHLARNATGNANKFEEQIKSKILKLVEPLEDILKKLNNPNSCLLPSIKEINIAYDIFKSMDYDLQIKLERADWWDADLFTLKQVKQKVLQNWDSYRSKMNPNLKLKAATTRQMMQVVENYQVARFGQSQCSGAPTSQIPTGGDDIFEGLSPDYYKSGPSSLSSAIEQATQADDEINRVKSSLEKFQSKLDERDFCMLPTIVELDNVNKIFNQLKPELRLRIEQANWLDENLYPLRLIVDKILQNWGASRNKMNPKLRVKGVINRHMQNLVEKYHLARFGRSPCAESLLVRGDALNGVDENLFDHASGSLESALRVSAAN